MIYCIKGESRPCFGKLIASNHRLRYEIFKKQKGWGLYDFKGMEYDAFDTPAAAHLVWADEEGDVRGTVRVSPTDRPYMIKMCWPDAVMSGALPNSPDVWEASRLCIDGALPRNLRTKIKG